MFVNNATELAHGVTVCSVPRPGGHGAACGGGSSGRGHSAPHAEWISPFLTEAPGLEWPQEMSHQSLSPQAPGDCLQPFGTRCFPRSKRGQFSLFQLDGAAVGSPGCGSTILSFGILQSRIHHPRSGLREVFMDSRWQRLSVCPSPPVLPLLPFILLAPRTPLLPLQGPRRCWRYHSDITAQLGWFGVKLALGSSLEKQL